MDDMLPPLDLAPSLMPGQIAIGANHATYGLVDGTVVSYGTGDQGQLDVPPELQRPVATIDGGMTAASGSNIGDTDLRASLVIPAAASDIAAGSYHTIVLASDGRVFAWGGAVGQSAVPLIAQKGVGRTSAGRYHSLALTGFLGQLLAWGAANGWVTSGTGSATPNSSAVLPDTLTAGGVTDFGGGIRFTAVLRMDGSVRVVGNVGTSTDVNNIPSGVNKGGTRGVVNGTS
jgi:hypothetical protein